ncbi:synaptojanin-1-like [Saccostrea echinata]|uniref:synaptojanin-1-like n=1 Tax=Saccostrea echinata TaxID=191078 RepID=UPI002A83D09E|nr:synaptojanin-1-like [Saccostrea echinata]
MAMIKNFRIFHKLEPPYSVIIENKNYEESLLLESNALAVLHSSEAELVKKQYTKILDAYGCLGVLNFAIEDNVLFLVLVTGCLSVGKICDSEIFRITSTHFLSLRNGQSDEERISEVKKLLNSGTFYFAWSAAGTTWDLTLCAQRKIQEHDTDNRFFWNRMLHVHFQRFAIDCDRWLFKMICGGVEIRTIYAAHRQAKACLISRLSCERAGTRFNVRGTNDDGHVANFVETEQVIFLDEKISSFIQTRGSVPLFWEQPGIQVGSHRVRMSRGHEASAPAFDRHLNMLKDLYGDQVLINLLGQKEGEHMLSQAYQKHHKASTFHQRIPLINFDYHSECRGSTKNLDKLKHKVLKQLVDFGYFYSVDNQGDRFQSGTMRSNCLDCLDRTNAVQSMLGMEMLPRQLESLGLAEKQQMVSRFLDIYRQIWRANGDHVSRIYAGTGALGGGRSKYSDATRSASRTIQNNFLDNSKQEAIDILLLGNTLRGELADKARALLTTRILHAPPAILEAMVNSHSEYTEVENLRIFIGTWNVNGGKHFRSIAHKHESISDWLLDAASITKEKNPEMVDKSADLDRPMDIFAIGFEEIVDLNASNIMKASTTNAREWQKELLKILSRDHKYVILTSVQLVGVILYVFIRPHLAPFIRDVATDSAKTGLGGAAGNKGGVAIRFLYQSTSLCFVCAHLSAGQSQVNDRNSDYHEISRKICFPMITPTLRKGRTVGSHDYVFWCGDFNYRIDLPREEILSLIEDKNWGALQACDQLKVQKEAGNVFKGFSEGPTDFAPTYKYDLFCNDYDSSEKCRCPAWTDRILMRRKPLIHHQPKLLQDGPVWNPGKMILYNRVELKTSDHRPVLALYDIDTLKVVENKKEQKLQEIVSQQGPPDGTVIVSVETEEMEQDLVEAIVHFFSDVGEIVLIRFVEADLWLIFKTGQFALKALNYDGTEINGTTVRTRLKTQNWQAQIQEELKICIVKTTPLYNQFSNSLLGEDFSTPAMEFESEEEDDAEVQESLLDTPFEHLRSSSPTGSGRYSPYSDDGFLDTPSAPPPRPQQVNRPPIPATGPNRESPEPYTSQPKQPGPEPGSRPGPPQRPTGPPAKPPPPQRPKAPPFKPLQTAAKSIEPDVKKPPPVVRKPISSHSIKKIKIKQQQTTTTQMQPMNIGLPTNVTHHGHATSIEDAQSLIEKLMEGGGNSLPPALLPNTDNKMVRSQTSESVTANKPTLEAPKPVPRHRSTENISSMTEAPQRPQRPRDSPPSVQPRSDTRPVPAPRREVQSMAIHGGDQLKPTRGPPPIPPTRPQSWMPSTGTVPDDQTYAVVNKTSKSIPDSSSQNILDVPLSPGSSDTAQKDPFDTSSVPSQFLNQAPQTAGKPPPRVSRPPPPVPTRQVFNDQDITASASADLQSDQAQLNDIQSNSENQADSPQIPSFSPPELPSFENTHEQFTSSMGSLPDPITGGPPSESPPPLPFDGPPSEPPPPLPTKGPPLEPPPSLPSNGPPSEPPPPPPIDEDDQFAEFKANFNHFQNSSPPPESLPSDPPLTAPPPIPKGPSSNGQAPRRDLPPVPTRGPATGHPPIPKRPMNLPPVPPRS